MSRWRGSGSSNGCLNSIKKGRPPGIRNSLSGHPALPVRLSFNAVTPNPEARVTARSSMSTSRVTVAPQHFKVGASGGYPPEPIPPVKGGQLPGA